MYGGGGGGIIIVGSPPPAGGPSTPTHNETQSDDDSDSDDPEIDNWEMPEQPSDSPKRVRPIGRVSTSWSPAATDPSLHPEGEEPSSRADTNVVGLDGIFTPAGLPDSGAGVCEVSTLPAPPSRRRDNVPAHEDPSPIIDQNGEFRLASHIVIGTRDVPAVTEEQPLVCLVGLSGVADTSLVELTDPDDDPMTPFLIDQRVAYGFSRLEIACPARNRVLEIFAPILLVGIVTERRRNATRGSNEDC
jgi:hypothetical protein